MSVLFNAREGREGDRPFCAHRIQTVNMIDTTDDSHHVVFRDVERVAVVGAGGHHKGAWDIGGLICFLYYK